MRTSPDTPSDENVIEFIELYDTKSLIPSLAINSIPEWYKEQGPYFYNDDKKDLTIKRCIPFLDAITSGYFLVTREDHIVSNNMINAINNVNSIAMHSEDQFGLLPIPQKFTKNVFKWTNPYLIKTPKDISCLFIHPNNNFSLPFFTMSGIVDTDSFINPVTFPFLLEKDFSGVITKGTPVVQIIPFRREKFNIKLDKMLNEELIQSHEKISNIYENSRYDDNNNPVGGMYKKDYWSKKEY